jgi:hypothetical protein
MTEPESASLPPASWRRSVVVATIVFTLLSAWALLIPPYQVSDEVQHAMRATSVLEQPWLAGDGYFILDQQRTNPIARDPGPYLGKLFFRGDLILTRDDVSRIRARKWGEQPPSRTPVREYWAGSSYPILYHLVVFSVAQPVTVAFKLTPYQSSYAYRFVSVTLATFLWALAFRELSSALGTTKAQRVLTLLLSIPMLVFPSAGTNPDAAVFPLATLAIVACWRLLRTGSGAGRAAAFLALTALTKPSGLPVGLAVAVGAGVTWLLGGATRKHALAVAGTALAAIAFSYACFYAWSPPRFFGSGPVTLSFGSWLMSLVHRSGLLWKMFWGFLGWLDYALPPLWYKVLAVIVCVNGLFAAAHVWQRRIDVYLPMVLGVFAATVILGEFAYLKQAGFNLQGRHLLPAAVGLAPLVLHRARYARLTLVTFLLVMHAAFVRETVLRYYGGNLGTLIAALPF